MTEPAARRTWLTVAAVGAATLALTGGIVAASRGRGGHESAGAAATQKPLTAVSAIGTFTESPLPTGPVGAPDDTGPPPIIVRATGTPVEPPVNRKITEPRSLATARLTRALQSATEIQLPHSTYAGVTVDFTSGGITHTKPLQILDRKTYYIAFAEVRDSLGKGQFEFEIVPYNGENPKRPFATYCDSPYLHLVECQTRVGPNGEKIMVEVSRVGLAQITEYRVDVEKPDGSSLVGTSRNMSDNSATYDNGPIERPTPPLTVDQLVNLMLAPDLTLYP
jgi:hypothetical protein